MQPHLYLLIRQYEYNKVKRLVGEYYFYKNPTMKPYHPPFHSWSQQAEDMGIHVPSGHVGGEIDEGHSGDGATVRRSGEVRSCAREQLR